MITRTPLSASDLRIRRGDKVLEIGPGHNPFFRANVILEKFIDTNYHRCGDVKVYPHQQFVHADGAQLPFKDKEFDYIYCSNVLEHVDDPTAFLKELSRVGKRGYIETPSIIGENLFPKDSHRWCIMELDGKLILSEKSEMPGNFRNDYGEAMLNYLPYQSLPFKMLQYSEDRYSFIRCEWKDSIECIVNPKDDEYARFFDTKWTKEMCERYFPPRSKAREILRTIHAFLIILKEDISKKLHRNRLPMPLSEYVKDHEVISYIR